MKRGQTINRIALAYEAGRDGFWLARWLQARGIEVHVIHSTSVAVSREHRRAKTDRLDTAMLMRVFLGWLRGERGHCGMVAIPTLEEEDAKRPSRERESLVGERTTDRQPHEVGAGSAWHPRLQAGAAPRAAAAGDAANAGGRVPFQRTRLTRSDATWLGWPSSESRSRRSRRPGWSVWSRHRETGPNAMVRLLASVVGVGVETADMLVQEVLSRNLRDRRAVARYAGLTGSPDESGATRREKGLAKAGNARVRRGLIQLAWRFLMFQKDSALAQWYRARTEGPKRRAQDDHDRGARPQAA